MRNKAINGVSDSDAVHQQNWVDSKEVEQGNDFTCAHTEVLFYNFSNVFTRVFT
ncbi:hypothetical protein D3C75_561910 [compost metagenome]